MHLGSIKTASLLGNGHYFLSLVQLVYVFLIHFGHVYDRFVFFLHIGNFHYGFRRILLQFGDWFFLGAFGFTRLKRCQHHAFLFSQQPAAFLVYLRSKKLSVGNVVDDETYKVIQRHGFCFLLHGSSVKVENDGCTIFVHSYHLGDFG